MLRYVNGKEILTRLKSSIAQNWICTSESDCIMSKKKQNKGATKQKTNLSETQVTGDNYTSTLQNNLFQVTANLILYFKLCNFVF